MASYPPTARTNHARYGAQAPGAQPQRGAAPAPAPDRSVDPPAGSHAPLDTGVHWDWHNPFNIIPATALFVLLLAIVGIVI